MARASLSDLNQCWFKQLSRSRALKLSTNAFCVGFPGWMKFSFTARSCDQKNIALLVSSGPLSITMLFGSGRAKAISSSKRARRCPEIDVSTTWPTHLREKSSTMLRMRIRLPSASWSCTKSSDQRSFTRVGTTIGTRGRMSFFRRFVRTCIPNSLYSR